MNWLDIKGYEGLYQISDTGLVKSLGNNKKRKEKIMTHQYDRGYAKVQLRYKNDIKIFKVHRLVALHFIPNPKGYPQVNHKDRNKGNPHIDNLEWCTNSYNQLHWRGKADSSVL